MLVHDDGRIAGARVVRVTDEVDSSNAAELRGALRRLDGGEPIVVDLRQVPFMDSAGLGALICGIRELRFREGRVAIVLRRGAVARLLSVTGFDRVIPTAPSIEEAVAAAGGAAGVDHAEAVAPSLR